MKDTKDHFGISIYPHQGVTTHLVHVGFHQHLTHQGLRVSRLVYGGVRPQAVAHHVQVGRLQPLDQHILQGLLQHGGDARDPLARARWKEEKVAQHLKNKASPGLVQQ